MAIYRIETRTKYGWTSDPEFLGCNDFNNIWRTEEEATAACDELAKAFGCERDRLRVVEIIDGNDE